MNDNDFKIKNHNDKIILEQDNQSLVIYEAVDNDIMFYTEEKEITIKLKLCTSNYLEEKTYLLFELLLKSIVGRYILSGDSKNKYSNLPEDFIDLNNNIITWHSDGSVDSTLIIVLDYESGFISISLIKGQSAKNSENNIVRIRTKGSDYGCYFQEFQFLLQQLIALTQSLEKKDNYGLKKTLKKFLNINKGE